MKLGMRMLGILICLVLMPAAINAQDQTQNSNEEVVKHLRIDFLLTEYNGQDRISSMPYTMYVEASSHRGNLGELRMGVRVPVSTGTPGQFNYTDVGTDIDCTPMVESGDSYDLILSVNRSSVYPIGNGQSETDAIRGAGNAPVIRNFNSRFNLEMHDGETTEGTSATDPFNGHVLKVTVALHVLK